MATKSCWLVVVATLLYVSMAWAQPSIRAQYQNDDQSLLSGRPRKRNDDSSILDRIDDSDDDIKTFQEHLESCHMHIPCGFAQYGLPRHLGSSSRSSRFKPIFKYTRSYCSCDGGYDCVLTDNRPDMDMYMFHCRQKDRSGHMFKFPNSRGWSLFLLPWQTNTLASSHRNILPIHKHSTQHVSLHKYYNQKMPLFYKNELEKWLLTFETQAMKKSGRIGTSQQLSILFSKYILQLSSQLLFFFQTSPPENFITQNSQRRKINPGLTSFIQECLMSTAKWMTHLTKKYSSSFYVVLIYFKTCSTFTQADTFLPQTFKWSNFGWNPTKCQISDVCILWII